MMRALTIMDPAETVKPGKDTSLDLMAVGHARGHTQYWCEAKDISAGSAGVFAYARQVALSADVRDHDKLTPQTFAQSDPKEVDLSEFGAIFIRKDPPFDDTYISLTLLLEPLEAKGVRFVNSPKGVRAISEKLSALNFVEAIPDTHVSYRVEALREFARKHDQVVLKPCYFGSGTGIVVTSHDAADFEEAVEKILRLQPFGPVIAQGFLPEVVDGDTRVMLVGGQVIGALGRKPGEGEFRANIAAGGHEFATELKGRQAEIAASLGPYLVENGILFAGLDFIGDALIEINVTSPTLVQQLRRLGGPDISALIWDRLEAAD